MKNKFVTIVATVFVVIATALAGYGAYDIHRNLNIDVTWGDKTRETASGKPEIPNFQLANEIDEREKFWQDKAKNY